MLGGLNIPFSAFFSVDSLSDSILWDFFQQQHSLICVVIDVEGVDAALVDAVDPTAGHPLIHHLLHQPGIHSFIHHPCIHSFISQVFIYSFIHHLLHQPVIHSFIHQPGMHAFIHSFISHVFIHSSARH